MNWFEIVNKATSYIEENITSAIKLEDVAMECHISYHYFSRIFAMITGFGLREYIRNRRITLASYEVSYTKEKIINIAFKYGYSSNESFSRAFKGVHGINPSVARRNKVMVYTHFPMLYYKIPTQNLISLSYKIVENIEYSFYGMHKYIVEHDYKEPTDLLNSVDRRFKADRKIIDLYNSKPTVYRIKYNLSYDTSRYDYMVGFSKAKNIAHNNEYININLKVEKGVKFIAKSINKAQIPQIREIIYKEWCKNQFKIDGVCEIEYTSINPNGRLDFFYIVSIK